MPGKRRLLIVGCGFVGTEIVQLARDQYQVFVLTRSESRVAELQALGTTPIVGDWLEESPLDLPEVDHVLVSVPHRAAPDHDNATHVIGLRNLLGRLPSTAYNLLYLSTTGVYGNCEDELVNESTPVSPTRIGPQIAVEAERWLAENCGQSNNDSPAGKHVVLRLAGIYGPGRVPLAAKLRAGEALAVPQEGFLNLAHVRDIARVILQILETPSMQKSCYVFSDGHPVQRLEFYRYLAKLCGVEEPRFETPDPTDTRARRATSKRVDPSQLLEELDFALEFPDYRTGLKHALG